MGSMEPAAGSRLIAAPTMADPNFARTIVLLLDAGDDGVTVAAETGVVSIPYADIHRSNLLGD